MQYGAIIPNQQIMRRPAVAIDEAIFSRMRHQAFDQGAAFGIPHAVNAARMRTQI